jgi:hypothetical protein
MMINEISDHLPVYSWGPYVQRAFELMGEGYPLLSTMHATTVDGVIEQLVEECDVAEGDVGHLAFVVPMFVGVRGGRRLRRVSEVAVLEPNGEKYTRTTVARWRDDDDAFDVAAEVAEIAAIARRLKTTPSEVASELERRTSFIDGLLTEHVTGIDAVQRRIFEFNGYAVVDEEPADV